MQCYDSNCMGYRVNGDGGERTVADYFMQYQREVNPNVFLHSLDLGGYGKSLLPSDNPHVSLISGFSDAIFKFLPLFERDRTQMVAEIERGHYD